MTKMAGFFVPDETSFTFRRFIEVWYYFDNCRFNPSTSLTSSCL